MRIFSFNIHNVFGNNDQSRTNRFEKRETEREKLLKPLRFSAHDNTPYDMNHVHFLFFISPLTFSILAYFEQQKKEGKQRNNFMLIRKVTKKTTESLFGWLSSVGRLMMRHDNNPNTKEANGKYRSKKLISVVVVYVEKMRLEYIWQCLMRKRPPRILAWCANHNNIICGPHQYNEHKV